MAHRRALEALRDELSRLPPPIIVYNKSHSGSRLLAGTLTDLGVFMGAVQNESRDALPFVALVEHLVSRYYPDYPALWNAEETQHEELARMTRNALEQHFGGRVPDASLRWGWKLCETLYALPFLSFLFPKADVIHLVRDGRDVAWSDHVHPEKPFWSKVYFNTDRLERWRGLWLTYRDYKRRSHLYNALHWVNSVEIGRAYGTMLGPRYRQLRYEDLCQAFAPTVQTLARSLGLAVDASVVERLSADVHGRSIGKHRGKPSRAQRDVLEIVEPTLLSLGYPGEHRGRPRGLLWKVLRRLAGG